MVMASFSLQVFLFFFSGFRKRYSSSVLRVLLWLAYLSADSLAVYVLGRLIIRRGGNQLALFWAPFLLLHLGGQETMTAFSMEDNALWKRHLLSLATQVPMAIYIVSKQFNGDDRRLVAPMVLVFASGTAKYAERIWALKRAGSVIPGTSGTSSSIVSRASDHASWDSQEYYRMLCLVVTEKQETDFEVILNVAADSFQISLNYLMGTTPSVSLLPDHTNEIENAVQGFKSSENINYMAYKMAEINLSLIYDYLYTKFGTRHFHMAPGCIACHRIVSLALTSVALGLFARAMSTGSMGHDAADVIISYILLAGAIVLEAWSIFTSFISSCWAYRTIMSCPAQCPLCGNFPGGIAVLLSIARYLHPENQQEWSGKLPQYSLIRKCIEDKQGSGLLRRMLRWTGMDEQAVTHISISREVKKVVLDKLLGIAATPRAKEWDISKFHGQWAQWVIETKRGYRRTAAGQVLQVSNIQGLEFVSSALLWHVVTDLCLLASDDNVVDGSSSFPDEHLDGGSSHHENNVDGGSSHGVHSSGGSSHREHVENSPSHESHLDEDVEVSSALRGTARELSDYIVYLVAYCGAIAGSDGHYAVMRGQREVSRWLLNRGGRDHRKVIEEIRGEDSSFFHDNNYPILDRARRVASDLHPIGESDLWELLAAVWIEMLCYIAYNCGAAFHTKHLTTGGEFVTHVKMLLFMFGVPFLRDTKEPLFPNSIKIVYS